MADDAVSDRDRFELERRRVALEERAARRDYWRTWAAVVVVFIPLLVAAVGYWQSVRNDEAQSKREDRQAQRDFELKAAEIVFADAPSPTATRNRAVVLGQLFQDRLPAGFGERFDETRLRSSGAGEVDAKKELIRLLANHPGERGKVLRNWRQAFPGDRWARELSP